MMSDQLVNSKNHVEVLKLRFKIDSQRFHFYGFSAFLKDNEQDVA